MNFIFTIGLLALILYLVDSLVTVHFVEFKEFEAPRWTNLPGGLTYWFLIRGK